MHRLGPLAFTTLLACTLLAGCKSTPSQSAQTEEQTPPPGQAAQGGAEATGAAPGQAAAQAPSAEQANTIEKPFLWSASKGGTTLHLLGTMHLGVDAAKQLPPWVWSRFDAASIVILEVDTKDPAVITSIMRTDGKTLEQELGPEHWAKLEQVVGGAMARGLERFKASAAATMIGIQGLPATPAMDMVIAGRAAAAKKELVYLEEASFQTALLDKHMSTRMLQAMLDDIDSVRKQNQQMLAGYLAGDAAALEALATDPSHWHAVDYSEAELQQMLEEFLYARNQAWIPKIEAAAGRGHVLVVVGALHLIGKRSVLDLLAGRGYTIERVTGP